MSKGAIHLNNQTGFALLQVMVALPIMAFMGIAMATMFAMQAKESRGLTEKLASLDLQRSASQFLTNSLVCNQLIQDSNLQTLGTTTFNKSIVTPGNPYNFSLKEVPLGGSAGALVTAGQLVSPLSNSLRLNPNTGSANDGIRLSITSVNPPVGKLLLNFDQSRLVRGIKNLEIPLNLAFSSLSPTSVKVVGCGQPSSPTGGCTSYHNGSPTALGLRNCWGTAIDNGVTMSCQSGSPVITGYYMDAIGPGEYATNGVDLRANCMDLGPYTCHVMTMICL